MKLSRYSIIGIMVALLLSALAIMPVFGAVTGTVVVNKSFVSAVGDATITVDDADLNVLLTATQTVVFPASVTTSFFDLKDTAGNSGASFATATGTADGDEVSGTPTITAVSGVATTAANYVVSVFNKSTGSIQISSNVTTGTTPSLDITYKLATINTTTADVSSPSSTSSVTVVLSETGADTGLFVGRFAVGTVSIDIAGVLAKNAATSALDRILAVAGQDITIKYTDGDPAIVLQTELRVESTSPAGTLVSPADGSYTTSLAPVLTVEFTDVDSTVDNGTFDFVIADATTTGDSDVKALITIGTPTITTVTNGFRAAVTINAATAATDKTVGIRWYASVTDKAGNRGQTDANVSVAGNQNYALVIDKQGPNFSGSTVFAGAWWDAANNKVETAVSKSINTSIGIKLPDALDLADTAFDLNEDLNGASVTAADFDIDDLKQASGVTVSDYTTAPAAVYSGATNWIFLTVPPMAPDAKPKVTLLSTSGGISDNAGNSTTSGSKVGGDSQAPTISAVLNRTLDDTDVTLTITTNEAGAPPTVTVIGATTAGNSLGNPVVQAVTLTGTNVYSSTIAPGFGLHSIKVVVKDTTGNTSTLGLDTPTADWPATGALGIYIDNALPAPSVKANNGTAAGSSPEFSNPFFITAAYTGEMKEYGLDAGGTLTTIANAVVTDLDIQNTVTIATATLDGVSILGLQDTQDNTTFNFAVLDIATGEHELVIVAMDEAGNINATGTIKFTVVARKPYSVAMSAGWNLFSFPGNPEDGALDTVLPSSHPATDVLSYDDGVWSVASRTAGGTWEGTLTRMDGNHGYWINTSSSEPIKALLALASVGSAATLPTIAVEAGWNLVAVIDLAQTPQGHTSGKDIQTGKNYFTSVNWSVAYTYDSSTRQWLRVTSTANSVKNGQGVWVWATAAGTLIP
ncbi:MAG: hypothetical protein O2826_05510 [Chloroflexi bacterium]|nr:hypothetical protein [Chloroflexota bacterium]